MSNQARNEAQQSAFAAWRAAQVRADAMWMDHENFSEEQGHRAADEARAAIRRWMRS